MSNRKLERIKIATDRFHHTRDVIVAELERGGAPRALLESALELCACYVECTGGTLVTTKMRAELAELHARVQETPVLRAVEPEPPGTYWPTDADYLREVERLRTKGWRLRPTSEGFVYEPTSEVCP